MDQYEGIARYLEYLKHDFGYQISVKDFVGFIPRDPDMAKVFGPCYIHSSPFCMAVKSRSELWNRCQENTLRLHTKCSSVMSSFVGRCYCGISEVIIPVIFEQKVIASIGLGGFEADPAAARARIAQICAQTNLDPHILQELYRASLTVAGLDVAAMQVHGGVLAEYLAMHYAGLVAKGLIIPHKQYAEDASRLNTLSNTIEFIRQHFAENIQVRDVARFCHCSESYINHLFKRNMDQSFSLYVNTIRVAAAQRLLADESLKIAAIASRSGFADPNYFANVFRQITGLSPSEYRLQIKAGV